MLVVLFFYFDYHPVKLHKNIFYRFKNPKKNEMIR